MLTTSCRYFFGKVYGKITLFLFYVVVVNLLAGYAAVFLKFPSLWGSSEIFLEYAMPFGMTWAMAHCPSLLLISLPLLELAHWDTKKLRRFRGVVFMLFLLLLYGVIEKIPFALFPAVDLLVIFSISLIVFPPSLRNNPVISISLIIMLLTVSVRAGVNYYLEWQHRVPEIKQSLLMEGLFELKSITVDRGRNEEMIFELDLKQHVADEELCDISLKMTKDLFSSYLFDENYHKIADVFFNPGNSDKKFSAYPLGYLIENHENDSPETISCFLKNN